MEYEDNWKPRRWPIWGLTELPCAWIVRKSPTKSHKIYFIKLPIRLQNKVIQIGILPLIYIYELADILFFIKSIKHPTDKFDILDYLNFTTGTTRSAGTKLYPKTARTYPIMNSYFYPLLRLWNSLPIIDLSQSLEIIKLQLKKFLWNHFLLNFDNTPCSFHYLCPCTRCSKTPAPSNYINDLPEQVLHSI